MTITPDKLSWDRLTQTGKTPTGNPVRSSAAGFPVDVEGVFYPETAKANQKPQGLVPNRAGTIRSYSYHDGVKGDYVTVGGTRYLVKETIDRRRPGLSTSHTEYGLVLEAP